MHKLLAPELGAWGGAKALSACLFVLLWLLCVCP